MKNKKIVAIIPARGASKGVPRKNIKELAGKPLIAYTIEAALKSVTIDRVIVSTDDHEIAEISRSYGAEVPFIRPARLATDDAPALPVLQHALKYLEDSEVYSPDIIVTLQPTSPLRDAEDIDKAVNKLLDTDADSVVSVCLAKHHPFWMKRLEIDRVYPFVETDREYTRRQDLPPVYCLNGAIFVTKRKILMEKNSDMGEDTRAIIMDEEKSIDVDTPLDFMVAGMLIKLRSKDKMG
jgi:CMP-N-acetylneuraminic acid synthetase